MVPGRYAVFDFAKNVQEFRANGRVTRVDDQTWSVDPAGTNTVTVSYKVSETTFQDVLTTRRTTCKLQRGVDLHVRGGPQSRSVKLTIQPPPNWKIINGWMDHAGQTVAISNWDVLVDTPTEIAPDWTQDTFEVDGKKYHVVVHSFGAEGGKRPGLVKDIEKIVRAQVAMWGHRSSPTTRF